MWGVGPKVQGQDDEIGAEHAAHWTLMALVLDLPPELKGPQAKHNQGFDRPAPNTLPEACSA
jgi:hypothetical protein